jgi:hypothetical protein
VINPITGWAINRFGVRRVVPVGGVCTAAFTALTAAVQDPFQFILVFAGALALADAGRRSAPPPRRRRRSPPADPPSTAWRAE